MVLSTLHTNSAPETLTRLRNMGIPSFNIATSVNLVIAQRLGRRLCSACKKPMDVPKRSLLEMGFNVEMDIKVGLVFMNENYTKTSKTDYGRWQLHSNC